MQPVVLFHITRRCVGMHQALRAPPSVPDGSLKIVDSKLCIPHHFGGKHLHHRQIAQAADISNGTDLQHDSIDSGLIKPLDVVEFYIRPHSNRHFER